MRVNPLIHMPLANLGSRIDDVSAAVINGGGSTGESAEGYRDIGMPAVAAALCCEQMPEPADERDDKRPPL